MIRFDIDRSGFSKGLLAIVALLAPAPVLAQSAPTILTPLTSDLFYNSGNNGICFYPPGSTTPNCVSSSSGSTAQPATSTTPGIVPNFGGSGGAAKLGSGLIA